MPAMHSSVVRRLRRRSPPHALAFCLALAGCVSLAPPVPPLTLPVAADYPADAPAGNPRAARHPARRARAGRAGLLATGGVLFSVALMRFRRTITQMV